MTETPPVLAALKKDFRASTSLDAARLSGNRHSPCNLGIDQPDNKMGGDASHRDYVLSLLLCYPPLASIRSVLWTPVPALCVPTKTRLGDLVCLLQPGVHGLHCRCAVHLCGERAAIRMDSTTSGSASGSALLGRACPGTSGHGARAGFDRGRANGAARSPFCRDPRRSRTHLCAGFRHGHCSVDRRA